MAGGQTPMVPYYPDKLRPKEYQWMDIYNALGRERTLFVGRFLDDESSNQVSDCDYLTNYNRCTPFLIPSHSSPIHSSCQIKMLIIS